MLLVACCGMSMFAQAPAKIRYQAVARDAENAIIQEKPVALQVSILQGSMTGTAVYVETSNVTTNFDGLMSFTIGEGTPTTGTLADVDWAKGPYFVQVAIDADGGTNYTTVATNQLLSVPYAFYAEKSANAFDGEYSGLINTPEIPVIPTQTSGYENDAEYITAEKQELSITGQNLSISEGNTIVLPTSTTIEFNDLTNHPEGKNTGDMLFWNDNTKKWEIVEAGKPGQVLGFFRQGKPAWGDMDENGALTNNNCGTLVDVDGNEYQTVIIGKQCWMADNLRVKNYQNADGSKGAALEVWSTTNRNSYYSSKRFYAEVTRDIIGTQVFYPWCTAVNMSSGNTDQTKKIQGICPKGWHVPSWVEFATTFEEIDDQWKRGTSSHWNSNGNQGSTTTSNNQLAIKLASREGHWTAYAHKKDGYGAETTTAREVNSPGYAWNNNPDDPKWLWNESRFSAFPAGYIDKSLSDGADAASNWTFNGTLNLWTSISNGTSTSHRPNLVKIACYNSGAVLYTYTNEIKTCYSVRCVNDNEF